MGIGSVLRLAATAWVFAALPALAETSSWQQRIVPVEPRQPPAPAARTKVKSEKVAPASAPRQRLSSPAGGRPRGPSLGPATTLTQPEAESQPGDPAYEAFDQGKYLTALSIAAKLATKGDPQAHTLVARIHAEGLGVPQNYALAAQWYGRADELGDIEGAFGLALLYARGLGVQKDAARAAALFEKAAAKGHAEACYNLALQFLDGRGKPENPRRAFALMTYAAERGVTAAMYDLGTLHATGVGTPPDAFQAADWIGKAAMAGHTEAEVEYAVLLFRGHGIPPDAVRAVKLLRSAAAKGVTVAQNRLARAYAHGLGVPKSPLEAGKWHLIAKSGGMADERLDELVAALPRAERQKAAMAAAEWRERTLLE